VPPSHSVRVEHRHQHKHEVLAQQMCPHVLLIEEEADHPVHSVAGRSFDRVHPCRNKDDWLVGPKAYDLLITERKPIGDFESFSAFVRGDDYEGDRASFVGTSQLIMSEE
jgi:hypothetical protein